MSTESLVQLFHIILVGGLFIYVGITRDALPKFMYPTLLVLGIIIFLYHIYKSFVKPKRAWINYIHMFLIAPLLVYIGYNGYNGTDTPRKFFELLLMAGFAAIGYHGFYLVRSVYPTKITENK
jgi:hypothetical protein